MSEGLIAGRGNLEFDFDENFYNNLGYMNSD
jgi:hypothetical protein